MNESCSATLDTEPTSHDYTQDMAKLTPAEQRVFATRMATNPPRSYRECATLMQKSTGTIQRTWFSIRGKLGYDPLQHWKETGKLHGDHNTEHVPLRNVSPDTIGKLLDMSIEGALRYISDPHKMAQKLEDASYKEIMSGIKESIGSRAVIRGEPTQIIRVDQRRNLRIMIPQMMQELSRRGIARRITAGKVIDAEAVQPEGGE